MADLVHKGLEGDYYGARQLHHRYFTLMKAMFLESNPMPVKAAAEMLGLIGPEIRLPLTVISEGTRVQLREAMSRVGLL